MAGSAYKGMMRVLGGMELDGRFCHTTQNILQFKTYEMSISGIFHVIFQTTVDHG